MSKMFRPFRTRQHKLSRTLWAFAQNQLGETLESLSCYTGIPTGTLKPWVGEDNDRLMPLAVLLALLESNPSHAADVLNILGARFGLIAVKRHETAAGEATEVQAAAFRATAEWGAFAGQVGQALADGELDSMERAGLTAGLKAHLETAQMLLAQLEDIPAPRVVASK